MSQLWIVLAVKKKIKIETSGLLGVSLEPGEKRLWPLLITAMLMKLDDLWHIKNVPFKVHNMES